MTQEEKVIFDEFGTAYPCCGNCENIRQAAFKLMCRKSLDYRDFGSIKCVYYKHKQHLPILEELL